MAALRLIAILFICWSAGSFAEDKRKKGFEFFDMIYTINLQKSTERREHVIAEFKRMGIKRYTIYKAIDKDSEQVKNLMQSHMVHRYPPCFRCDKIFCKCANNVLIKPQIGNWLSFINVFKDIVKNKYEYVLITEDDVKFTDDAKLIIESLINEENFAFYNIDPQKPLLISLYDDTVVIDKQDIKNISFKRENGMSNACFIVNKLFAESFLRNLKKIDTTSDIYIHNRLLKIDPNIQFFSAYPKPAYQLSLGQNPSFYSTIHPKGIDETDKKRMQQHKKRIEYWEYLAHKLPFMGK